MAQLLLNTSALGSTLQGLLTTNDEIVPGYSPSYELCKQIYLFHPLGAKLIEKPLEIAQSERREISVPNSPETRVVEAFNREWDRIGADKHIRNVMRLSRIYGIASVALLEDGVDVNKPVDYDELSDRSISFNCYDPMNTAGSLVLNQDPMSLDFQHTTEIRVKGQVFHRSRTCVVLNEAPIYISFTSSAFGFVGRSAYQRALYPMKSYIQTLVADDMMARKLAVLVAKIKQPGSVINNAMIRLFGAKRALVKEAENGNVISIGTEGEEIESLNFQNADGPLEIVRKQILENIASASGMPAKLLTEETYAEGFGEGIEDSKAIARYIDGVRDDMKPLYDFYDRIVMHRAWNEAFFKTVQKDYQEYAQYDYETAFWQWKNSFAAKWPSLLKEPDSELVKVDEVRLRAVVAWVQTLMPTIDPENKARLIEWAVDNFNSLKFLFDVPLQLDYEELAQYEPPQPMAGQGSPAGAGGQPGGGQQGQKPAQQMKGMGATSFGRLPSSANDAVEQFSAAVDRMLDGKGKPPLKLVHRKKEE
jgi:hypothetical protein